jgi:hypothetical protein
MPNLRLPLVRAVVSNIRFARHSASRRSPGIGDVRRGIWPVADVIGMIVRRAVAIGIRADPIAAVVARVAAAGRIIMPFAPIELAVAAGAAGEAIHQANQPAATGAETAAASRAAATGRAAFARAAAIRFATSGRPGAGANRRTALAAARPGVAGELPAVHALVGARRLAAATGFAATGVAPATGTSAADAQQPTKIHCFGGRRREERCREQNDNPIGVSHLLRILGARAGARRERRAANRKSAPPSCPTRSAQRVPTWPYRAGYHRRAACRIVRKSGIIGGDSLAADFGELSRAKRPVRKARRQVLHRTLLVLAAGVAATAAQVAMVIRPIGKIAMVERRKELVVRAAAKRQCEEGCQR